MLVGDAKQAIYRWRGGKAEQFIDLFNKKTSPFQVKQNVENLENNYRSFKEVVSFNNNFFNFLAKTALVKDEHKDLYERSQQNITKEKEGYVELSFLEISKEDDRNELFPEQVLNKINTCLKNGFKLEDICVLVRKKKEGVAVANYLSQQNIPIISSETLLLINSKEVIFINDLLGLLIQPKNNEIKVKVLNYLATLFNISDKHDFFINHINLSLAELFKSLEDYSIFIRSSELLQLSLY